MLVADDYVTVTRKGEKLFAEAPATIRGKLEVRGLGIVTVPCRESAELVLIAELVAPEQIERYPDPAPVAELGGVKLPLLHIAPFEASAPVKLLVALAERFKRSSSGI
jgi:serine kinase of HPr protein (carbohydrate metabolism regulator)